MRIRIIGNYVYRFCNPEYLMFELMKMLRGGCLMLSAHSRSVLAK